MIRSLVLNRCLALACGALALLSPLRATAGALEVRIPADSVELAATLYVPDGAANRPAGVVILHGSGDSDRSELRHMGQLDCLIDAGFVVLDFDKRGIGGSGGTYTDGPDLHALARDGAAAVRFLRSRPEVDPKRVGIWGISQGGWVGEIMAADDPSLAFAILISAPGVSPVEQGLYQRVERLREEGEWTEAELTAAYPVRRLLWRYYQTGEGRAELERAWSASRDASWFAKLKWGETPTLRDSLRGEQREFFMHHGNYEPAADLEATRVPLLCLFGAKDRHIPVDASVRAMEAAFAKQPHSRATIRVFPDAGHGMQLEAGPAESLKEMDARHSGAAPMPHFEMSHAYCSTMRDWLREIGVR